MERALIYGKSPVIYGKSPNLWKEPCNLWKAPYNLWKEPCICVSCFERALHSMQTALYPFERADTWIYRCQNVRFYFFVGIRNMIFWIFICDMTHFRRVTRFSRMCFMTHLFICCFETLWIIITTQIFKLEFEIPNLLSVFLFCLSFCLSVCLSMC